MSAPNSGALFASTGADVTAAPAGKTLIKLDVTSDSICPFCYIGKRKLERAIELARERELPVSFDVEFKPFLLDPTLREDAPVDKQARYIEKFGAARAPKMHEAMKERGKAIGIDFSFGGKMRQTTESHRLIALAYEKGGTQMQSALVDRLFNGYFEREQDIGDVNFLAAQAVGAGLFPSEEDAKAWLASDEKKEDVARGIREAQMMGVTGVPFFVLNNKYAISGAEEPELFLDVFERLVRDAQKTQSAHTKTSKAGIEEQPQAGLVC